MTWFIPSRWKVMSYPAHKENFWTKLYERNKESCEFIASVTSTFSFLRVNCIVRAIGFTYKYICMSSVNDIYPSSPSARLHCSLTTSPLYPAWILVAVSSSVSAGPTLLLRTFSLLGVPNLLVDNLSIYLIPNVALKKELARRIRN